MNESYNDVLLPTTRFDSEILAAQGSEIKVNDGTDTKWVIDGTAQVGTNPLGHRNKDILAAIEQFYADETPTMLAGNDFYHPYQRELAEVFTRLYPGAGPGNVKTYYCNSGSEAVERGCLKSAQQTRGGNTYIAFRNAFHGRTALALSCNFSKAAHTEGYNSMFRALPVPFAAGDQDTDDCLNALEQDIIREGAANINAVIMEPIQGEGGYVVPHDDFLPGVRDITAEYGIPLVLDEVQASLRTGEWFACQNWDIKPDMIAVAKAFSGGVEPFGAALIRNEHATPESGKHSGTFGGNPKECFIALKTIEIIEENNYLDHARKMGGVFDEVWNELEAADDVVDVRGIGLMRGIEFADAETRDRVLHRLYDDHDILTLGCGNDAINPAIRFLLPVNVEEDVVERVAQAAVDAATAV